ncbi:hypothetical protein F4703DRAFT_1743420 [Phycomyces blakesleeanus]
MDSSKARLIAVELDTARCKGDWQAIPELAKRYKKCRPNESVLETTVCVESDFIAILRQVRNEYLIQPKETTETDIDYVNDSPHLITIQPRLTISQVQSCLKRLETFSKIIVARIYCESGRYTKALEALKKLALPLDDVNAGYGLVLLVQARVIKGFCFEMEGDVEAALACYNSAWDVASKHLTEKNESLSFWVEECLYRTILLRLRVDAPIEEILSAMRGYVQMVSTHWPVHWRIHKRWIIFRHTARYLTQICQEDNYIPAPTENSVANDTVSELVDIIMEGHRIIGWGSNSDVQRVNQFLCDVKEMTFNNPGVMRHKFFVLIRLGEFEEALYSLRSYAELIGLPDIDKTDYDSSESDQTTAIKISPADKAALIQTRLDALSAVEGDVGWNSDSHASKENEMNVLSVLLAGAQLYGREYKSGILAATVSELALTLYQRVSLVRSNDNNILAQCYLVRGVSLCLLAIQSCDENTRSANFTESIALLKASVKAAPSSWRAYYELSLAQAQTRDIKGASISISKSIELNPEHLPSWHLLALLCSCKQNKSVFESLETIEADKCSRYYFETAESYLTTRMSQILFLETLEGPRSVLKLYPELFTIYSKLSQSLDLNEQLGLITAISKTSSRPTSPTLPKSPTSPTSLRQSRIGTEDQLGLITPIPRSTSARTQSVTRKRTQSRKASLDYPRDMSEPPLPTDIPVPMSPLLSETETLKAFTTKMTQEINETVSNTVALDTRSRSASDGSTTFVSHRRERWNMLLMKLWLMVASTYMRAGFIDDAMRVISEVEDMSISSPMIWYQLGVLCIKIDRHNPLRGWDDIGIDSFKKALNLDPEHVETQVALANVYLDKQEPELAEFLLLKTTSGTGWDSAEAWYMLGTIYQKQEKIEQAKCCLFYALELNETTPLCPFSQLPCFV